MADLKTNNKVDLQRYTSYTKLCNRCTCRKATVGMFVVELNAETNLHIEATRPTHCPHCAQSLYDNDSTHIPRYFGFLNEVEMIEYQVKTKDNSPSERLHLCGIDLHKKSSTLAALLQQLSIISHGKDLWRVTDRLKNSGGKNDTDYRRWKNIEGDITGCNVFTLKQLNSVKHLRESFFSEIEDIYFPTEKYAKIARYNATKEETHQLVLTTSKFYMMARYGGLKQSQVPHQDNFKYNLTVICVAKCAGENYPFFYYDGTHVLAFEIDHDKDEYPNMSKRNMLPLPAKQGDCIIFFTPLIHCGGPSSWAKNNSIAPDTLTDLVYAFHCDHFGLPSGKDSGRGKVQYSHLNFDSNGETDAFETELFSEEFSKMRQLARNGFMMKLLGKRKTTRNVKGYDGDFAL